VVLQEMDSGAGSVPPSSARRQWQGKGTVRVGGEGEEGLTNQHAKYLSDGLGWPHRPRYVPFG